MPYFYLWTRNTYLCRRVQTIYIQSYILIQCTKICTKHLNSECGFCSAIVFLLSLFFLVKISLPLQMNYKTLLFAQQLRVISNCAPFLICIELRTKCCYTECIIVLQGSQLECYYLLCTLWATILFKLVIKVIKAYLTVEAECLELFKQF